jgi:hypothetical protein
MVVICVAGGASAQLRPRPPLTGHKMRIAIDSQPQQAAIYIDSKDYGIEGYTPATVKLPKGLYTIILEAPGFKPLQRQIQVTRSGPAPLFTLERLSRPATLDIRSVSNDSASGGQLLIDGAPSGTVPARVELSAGQHLVEVKKAGFQGYRETANVVEGETRTMVIELTAEAKKGSILVTADVAGADIYVDGSRRDATPALIGDLLEGEHTIEVRKDPLPPFKTVVRVEGNKQTKVDARIQAQVPQVGSFRVVSSTPGAEVLIDGEAKGPANAEIANLKPGKHFVEVRAKGFQPQSAAQEVASGETRLWQVDLQPVLEKSQNARLRLVTPVPDAEVFIDGASVGHAPVDRNDLQAGKHYVVVRARGYAEWKREVNLEAGSTTPLTADLSASGTVKVISNVPAADVFLDGQKVGVTPITLPNLPAGDHFIEVKKLGYQEGAKLAFHLDGGQEKLLPADLVELRHGLAPAEQQKVYRGMTSFSAVTVEPNKFTADIYGGFYPFGGLRLTVGAFRKGYFGIDAGVEGRTIGYLTEGLAHVKFEAFRGGPVAFGADIAIGGGGGPGGHNDFVFEAGVLFTLLFGDLVRFTSHPYMQVYTDRLCPDMAPAEQTAGCKAGSQFLQNRDAGFRLMLQGALEIAVAPVANIFFIFEGDPIGARRSYTDAYSPHLLSTDPQVYGRFGVTFKF